MIPEIIKDLSNHGKPIIDFIDAHRGLFIIGIILGILFFISLVLGVFTHG